MPVAHFASGSETGTGTAITWTLPAGVIAGDKITLVVQTDSAVGVTMPNPPGIITGGSGRVPGAGALAFYAWHLTASGGEAVITTTATSSTPWYSGFIVVRGRNLFLIDSNGNSASAPGFTSPATNALADSMLVAVDGANDAASSTCTLSTATPTLTVTEQFDSGSTTPDCYVAGYTAPISSATSSLVITVTRSITPTAHTALWYIWGEGPEQPSRYVSKVPRMRASNY